MLRDVENQARTEVDPILGDLLARAPESDKPTSSVLNIAFNHLKAYEARRVRAAA